MNPEEIVIPPDLIPADGRFGSGPSKVRPDALEALSKRALDYMGTSHRQAPVRDVVGRLRAGLTDLFRLPSGYEVLLGLGGTTVLWDALVFSFIARKSRHFVFGEFSSKFAQCVVMASHLDSPELVESQPGTRPLVTASERADTYALTHTETSTGVAMPVRRPSPAGMVIVDATSAAGGMLVDPTQFDVYYFAPQKCFASDGGLWIALCSPGAIRRIEEVGASDRYIPPSLSLQIALENARLNQTYNTPALATIFLTLEQVEWFLANGGLTWAAGRSDRSSATLYAWAERSDYATPFVADPAQRSSVVGTIDLDPAIDAGAVSRALRANGIVDTEPYRKLGRNQLRVGMYPAVDPEDVEALTACIDHVVGVLA